MVRDNLIQDAHNVGMGLMYLGAFICRIEHDEDLGRSIPHHYQVSTIRAYWGHLSKTPRHSRRWYGTQQRLAKRYLGGVPDTYRCTGCDAHGVKLWRQYQTCADAVRLLCAECGEHDQQASHTHRPAPQPGHLVLGWRSEWARGKGDSIGWLVPAVPTEDGSYWGYTSVPEYGVIWWKRLPAVQP